MLLNRGPPVGPGVPGSGLPQPGGVPQGFGIRLSTVGRGPEGAGARAGPVAAGGAWGRPGEPRPHVERDFLSPPDEPPLSTEQLQQPHATLWCHRGAAR